MVISQPPHRIWGEHEEDRAPIDAVLWRPGLRENARLLNMSYVGPVPVLRIRYGRARVEASTNWRIFYETRQKAGAAPPRPTSFAVRLGVGTVGESFRVSRPVRTSGYSRIVR